MTTGNKAKIQSSSIDPLKHILVKSIGFINFLFCDADKSVVVGNESFESAPETNDKGNGNYIVLHFRRNISKKKIYNC